MIKKFNAETHTKIKILSKTVKQKQEVIDYKAEVYKIDHKFHQFLIKINKTSYHTKTQKIKNSTSYIVTNLEKNMNFLDIKMNHWQVETFHKIKDSWLYEDKFHKNNNTANAFSAINNFISILLNQFNIKSKNQIKVFQQQLIKVLTFLFYLFLSNITIHN